VEKKIYYNPDGTVWEPEFPKQRPPFQKGVAITRLHGANPYPGSQTVGPRAEEILARYKAMPSWPPYLEDPSWAPALRSWSRAEAVCELLTEYLAGMDIQRANSDIIDTVENSKIEINAAGAQLSYRQSKTHREASPLEMLRKFETIASNHRNRLGLDPLGRARLGKDISQTKTADLAAYWQTEGES